VCLMKLTQPIVSSSSAVCGFVFCGLFGLLYGVLGSVELCFVVSFHQGVDAVCHGCLVVSAVLLRQSKADS